MTTTAFLSRKSVDIPPRKLLGRRSATGQSPDEASFHKFLPRNADSDDDSDPYSSDEFRMYEFKIRRCTRSRSHDWTDCPFAHPGEKARRRDPRKFRYSGDVCADFRGGHCPRGDNCDFSHGVFECWLHPARYRTEACKDGKNCKRKVCFFAHTPKQIRVSPCDDNSQLSNCNHCVYCHSVSIDSPTSTLIGFPQFSPANSPPLSPLKSRFSDRFTRLGCRNLNYTDSMTELGKSVERMNLNRNNMLFVDVNFNNLENEQHQFVLSPSTPDPCGYVNGGDDKFGENGLSGPDLGWVNDLLT